MSIGFPGLQGAFAKVEDYGMSFHYANVVIDKEGTGNDMIQYSYISLKQDALYWLRENGRLPSADIDEYFQEIRQMKELQSKVKEQEEEIITVREKEMSQDAEIRYLKAQIQ